MDIFSITINQSPHDINNTEKSERSVRPKIVNTVLRVKSELLKYSKTQFVLSEIEGQLLYSENKDTNKHFLQEGLQHNLKTRGEEAKLFYQ